jgi:S-(hydroxymethyl)glutathione dehydrogenase / alcohol dehydrogenase
MSKVRKRICLGEMTATAAILTEINKPLELREIEWAPLSYGQVLVKVLVSGICGAQLAEIRGDKNLDAPMPRLMGHEAAVQVLETGPGVTHVKEGDLAVAHWRIGGGVESENPRWTTRLEMKSGNALEKLFTSGKITTFSTHSVVSENRLTAVAKETPVELCALLGCSLSTALGVIEHEAKLLMGDSVLIIGCGGLGLNLILAAKQRGAARIVSHDNLSSKKEPAISVGSDFFYREFNFTDKFDVVIDTTGNALAIAHGIECLAPSGRFIMVGQPKPRENVTLTNARHMFDGSGKSIIATQGGRCQPSVDIPRWINAYRACRFSIEGIVSHRFSLEKINEALDCVRNGQAGRVLIDCQ